MGLERLTAALAGRYRIERELGQGGMATVYLAQDLKHGRRVAIKVLRPDLAAVIGAERFLREIKTIATLQHPHILGLIDSGEVEGTAYFVMPYVEGESLRDRLTREKQLPIAQAVRLATEVASALDYAHRHGVIHRDIKPENILLHDGQALVADFGISLAVTQAGGSRMTETGLSLGTPHYMSPEQAMGEREISAASDVYALGCVTYEMLTGEPPFTGATVQAIIAKMMTEKPTPPSRVRDTVPDGVEDAVLTALAKLPADRWRTASEFSAALAGSGATRTAGRPSPTAVPATARPVWFGWLPWLTAGACLIAALAAWRSALGKSPAILPTVRFELQPATGSQFAYPIFGVATYLALSPDGRQAVYAAAHGGTGWALDIRSFDQLTARTLPGTERALYPAFSPDGRWIAFGAPDGTLKKVATDGTGLTTLCPLDGSGLTGVTWISSRQIVFDREDLANQGLRRVSADGGQPEPFAQLDSASGERLQLSPQSADDGRLVFYTSSRASNLDLTIGVISTATGRPKVFSGLHGARPVGLAGGFLFYVRGDGAMMAAPFDVKSLTAGAPLQILDSVAVRTWMAPAALSASGSLLYQRGALTNRIVEVDQHGTARTLIDSVRVNSHPRLSPDGRSLAFEVQGGTSSSEIWIADLASHTTERLTRDAYNDRPEWTPDGTRVMYSSTRTRVNSLWWQPANGGAAAELLYQGIDPIREGVFTPDGKSVVYRSDTRDRNRDIYLLPLEGKREPVPLVATGDDERQPRVSPDGRWLAYVSNESGREEVYVRALAGGGGRIPVSTGGGGEPLWSSDSRRIFYRAAGVLLSATIATAPALAVSGRETLFEGPFVTDVYHPNYDVARDGKTFVMLQPAEQGRQIVMVVNWLAELRQRLGINR